MKAKVLVIGIHFVVLMLGGCSGEFQKIAVSSTPTGVRVCLDREDSSECITTPGSFKLKREYSHVLVAVYGQETQRKVVESRSKLSGLFWTGAILGGPVTAQTVYDSPEAYDYELVPKKVHFDFEEKGEAARGLEANELERIPTEKNEATQLKEIGYYYLSKNDKARAKEYLSRSFQLNHRQPDVARALGRLGVVLKIPGKTENDLKKLNKIVGQDIGLDDRLGPRKVQKAELKGRSIGGFIITTSVPDAEVFIIPWPSGIDFNKDHRTKLRDVLLDASPVEAGKQLEVEPGTYVVAVKSKLPRRSKVLFDLGGSAPNNLLVPSSKTGKYQAVIGGGIVEGALFKRVKDVYAAKYNYLRIQGNKDIMFRFLEGRPTFELWLISDWTIKPGIVWKLDFRVPEK